MVPRLFFYRVGLSGKEAFIECCFTFNNDGIGRNLISMGNKHNII